MNKTVYTMNIDNYMPELCVITIPSIKNYADKIDANFHIIQERQFQEWPITYEKFQIYELGKDNEWNIFIDADTIILEDMPDLTKQLKIDHLGVHMAYDADKTLPYDHWFAQDGRNVGIATNFIISHHKIHKIWTPLDEPCNDALRRLEQADARPHIIDELCMSRNLARYRIMFTGLTQFTNKFMHLDATSQPHDNIINTAKELAAKC